MAVSNCASAYFLNAGSTAFSSDALSGPVRDLISDITSPNCRGLLSAGAGAGGGELGEPTSPGGAPSMNAETAIAFAEDIFRERSRRRRGGGVRTP